ncbi:MAG: fibronectin type III domain-containing protein [Candidatus Eisenbacteria sp.]|nr:fibronectin type III domain-containing protein [Candidatus Eisenbacteria bacterium]
MQTRVTTFAAILLLSGAALIAQGCGISGTGAGDDPAQPDPVDLQISDLTATTVTDTSALVTWMTSSPAIGVLRYGVNATLNVTTSLTTEMATTHSISLASLSPGTTYHYRVQALTAAGDTTSQRGAPFSTELPHALRDTTAPEISEVSVTAVTSSSTRIAWQTDDHSRGLLTYGPTRGYGQSAVEYPADPGKYSHGHSLVLTGLTPETTYYFMVQATNPAGLTGQSQEHSFTTRRAPTLEFCTDSLEVVPGETFTLSLCLAEIHDLAGIAVTIAYDPQAIEFLGGPTGYAPGEIWEDRSGHMFMAPKIDDLRGRVLIEATWTITYEGDDAAGTEADGEGVFCSLTCRLAADAPLAPTPISLLLIDQNGDGQPDTRLLDAHRLPIEFAARGAWVLPQAED